MTSAKNNRLIRRSISERGPAFPVLMCAGMLCFLPHTAWSASSGSVGSYGAEAPISYYNGSAEAPISAPYTNAERPISAPYTGTGEAEAPIYNQEGILSGAEEGITGEGDYEGVAEEDGDGPETSDEDWITLGLEVHQENVKKAIEKAEKDAEDLIDPGNNKLVFFDFEKMFENVGAFFEVTAFIKEAEELYAEIMDFSITDTINDWIKGGTEYVQDLVDDTTDGIVQTVDDIDSTIGGTTGGVVNTDFGGVAGDAVDSATPDFNVDVAVDSDGAWSVN